MKSLFSLLLIILLFSCSGKEKSDRAQSENILDNLTFTVDTVVVDPVDEIINLNGGLYNYTFNQDFSTLFKFDFDRYQLQEIDLNQLKLSKIYPFEKEGPNGVGQFGGSILEISGDRFIFAGPRKIGMFSKSGILNTEFDFSVPELITEERPKSDMLNYFLFIEEYQKGFFLETVFNEPIYNLVSIDFNGKSSQIIDLPEMDQTYDYRVVYDYDGYKVIMNQLVLVQSLNSKVYIISSVKSGLYRYDPQLDSLEYITFPLKLTALEKTKTIRNEVSSEAEKNEQYSIINSEIRFDKLLWDEQSKRFFRFSSLLIPSNSPEPSKKHQVFLSAFNADLNLIGEKELEGIYEVPSNPFFKDGKLWSYVNVEDELGFAVFTFDF
jgi:hypothetical protein